MKRHPLTQALIECKNPEQLVRLLAPDIPERIVRDAVTQSRVRTPAGPVGAPLRLGSLSSHLPLI